MLRTARSSLGIPLEKPNQSRCTAVTDLQDSVWLCWSSWSFVRFKLTGLCLSWACNNEKTWGIWACDPRLGVRLEAERPQGLRGESHSAPESHWGFDGTCQQTHFELKNRETDSPGEQFAVCSEKIRHWDAFTDLYTTHTENMSYFSVHSVRNSLRGWNTRHVQLHGLPSNRLLSAPLSYFSFK